MTILLTGFNRFRELEVNPSEIVIQNIAAAIASPNLSEIKAEVLRTEFAAAGQRIQTLIHEYQPQVVIGLGVATGTDAIRLERVALNLNDTGVPDNAGVAISGQRIVPDGPTAYWSTLPLEPMRDALQACGIPVKISNHAGTYVCNHLFYLARHQLEQLGSNAKCGFIHIPLITEQLQASTSHLPSLPLATVLEAIACCLEVIQNIFVPQ